nr:MAG TPA: hypothetical protein [Caudoviricetes sp.]
MADLALRHIPLFAENISPYGPLCFHRLSTCRFTDKHKQAIVGQKRICSMR